MDWLDYLFFKNHYQQHSSSNNTTKSNFNSDVAKGISITIVTIFLAIGVFFSILIPLTYYFVIWRRKEHFSQTATSSSYCSWISLRNYITTLPLGRNNAQSVINDNGSFAIFQSTLFSIVMVKSCCKCMKLTAIRSYNVSCWCSIFLLLFARVCLLVLAVVTATYSTISERRKGDTWIAYTQYLTNNSFNVFVVYSVFVIGSQLVFMIVYGIFAIKTNEMFPYTEGMPKWLAKGMSIYADALWVLAELNLVTSILVAMG